jgi:parallel beta-helix repeat protein
VVRSSEVAIRNGNYVGNQSATKDIISVGLSSGVPGGDNVTVERNTVKNGLRHGITFLSATNSRASRNTVTGNATGGIVASDGNARLSIDRNTCTGNGNSNIIVDVRVGATTDIVDSSITVTGNIVESATTNHGIYVQYAKGVLVEANQVRSNNGGASSRGIFLVNCERVLVLGNLVTGNRTGIDCGNGAGAGTVPNVIRGNEVYGSVTANFADTGTVKSVFEDNETDDTGAVASANAITLPLVGLGGKQVFVVSGTATILSINSTGGTWQGRRVTLIFSGTAATNGVTDGSNLNLTGNFAYSVAVGGQDTMELVYEGTTWHELGRSAN